ncbi:MAG: ubiquinol-cytochrome C chaperone family protein [Sphingomicrobium sp.]
MLKFLFPRLTDDPARGAQGFAAITRLARNPAYFRDGGVPDTLDGRFALLASVTALALVRVEREGSAGEAASVALTERFIEAMEAEHRELGMSDPTLGKTIRKLVGALSGRVDAWRGAVAGDANWADVTRISLFKSPVEAPALDRAAALLRSDWGRLDSTLIDSLMAGEVA